MNRQRSEELFELSKTLIPGGVNSPVRAFGSVGGTPPFIERAQGSRIWDVDGNEYIDMVGSWGPMILGHGHPEVKRALANAIEDGVSFGAPTEAEAQLAQLVLDLYPACERVRFVNSGTEATMSALRLARAVTGRDLVIKFEGNYHGHGDSLLVAAGSGALTTGVPSSAGIPEQVAATTLVARYNDADSVAALFERHPERIAAVIVEPVAGNMGVVPPEPGFHPALRELTRQHGALLVVDEVMTGFRVARGGATGLYNLDPDLICWGKIVGGGLPVGAYGGPARFMDQVSPAGPVYQAGTLSGNPLAMAAGLATLSTIAADQKFYERLDSLGARLQRGLEEAAQTAGVPLQVNRVGSMVTPFFTSTPVRDYETATGGDRETFRSFFHGLLERGVYWPPSPFEAAFISQAHSEEDVDAVIKAAAAAILAADTSVTVRN